MRLDNSRNSCTHSGHSGNVDSLSAEEKNISPPKFDFGSPLQHVGDNLSNDVDDRHKGGIISTNSIEVIDTNPNNLKVGSIVQFGKPARYAMIKWIGKLPNETETSTELEMVIRNFVNDMFVNIIQNTNINFILIS